MTAAKDVLVAGAGLLAYAGIPGARAGHRVTLIDKEEVGQEPRAMPAITPIQVTPMPGRNN